MHYNDKEIKLIAKALYEIRLLLSSCLGSTNDAELHVREAAHLSYALHNQALAIVEGKEFDMEDAIRRIKAIKQILPGSDIPSRILDTE
jgi:hypothetical protein